MLLDRYEHHKKNFKAQFQSETFFIDFELMFLEEVVTRPRLAGDAVLRWWRELVILEEAAFIEEVSDEFL